jgi:predicted permease
VPPPAATTPAPSISDAAAAAESDGVGPFGWLVLIGLVAAIIIGGLLIYRARRKTDWDAEAGALEAETRTVTTTRLPPVLTATTAGQRGLAWPPVRASLVDLVARWNALAERASGEPRRNRSLQISGLLQDLIAAVDAENEALAVGRDWTLLRPRVIQADRALAATLANQPQPEPPPTGEPGPPAYQP